MTTVRARLAPGRSVNDDTFSDITDAPVVSVLWGASGELEVTFDGDLTTEERQRVVIRLISADAAEESTLLQARSAHIANAAYLDKTSRTNAEVLAQVADLTRQVNHLIRYVARL